jgi:hypothetical protein
MQIITLSALLLSVALGFASEKPNEEHSPSDTTEDQAADEQPADEQAPADANQDEPAEAASPPITPADAGETEPVEPVRDEQAAPKAANSKQETSVADEKPTLVLYKGDVSIAMSRLVSATKRSSDSFRPVMITEISGGEPILDGSGGLEVCNGASSDGRSLRNALKKVRKDIAYVKYADADDSLRTATTYLNCLTDPLIGLDAAELYFMKGFLDYELGRQGLSQESFRRALVYDPEMDWDNNFPPKALELFEAAQAERETAQPVKVRLLPIPAEGSAWVDGVPLRARDGVIEVLPGAHLLQFSVPQVYTVSLYVKADSEPSVMLPALMPNQAVSWANNEDQRNDLGVLLGAILEDEKEIFVSNAGEVWRFSPARHTWEQLEVPNGFFVADQERIGKFYASQALFWSGSVAIASGGIFGIVSVNNARQAQDAYGNAVDYLPREDAQTRYNLARSNTYAGLGVFLSGVALAGTSFAIQIDGKPIFNPQWRRGGGGVTINMPLR